MKDTEDLFVLDKFGGEININNLPEVVAHANAKWANLHPALDQAYQQLMINEAFWCYPHHYGFSKLPHWHSLGSA
jgi:hypothetical protein